MNNFEINNKLNMIFEQLLDLKFHLGEIETEKRCKKIEEENKINQERLSSLQNMHSNSWQYRRKLEEEFNKKYDNEKATKKEN